MAHHGFPIEMTGAPREGGRLAAGGAVVTGGVVLLPPATAKPAAAAPLTAAKMIHFFGDFEARCRDAGSVADISARMAIWTRSA
jgi:hypothetical protein